MLSIPKDGKQVKATYIKKSVDAVELHSLQKGE